MGGRWARLVLVALLCIGARAERDAGEALMYEVPLEIAVAALVRDYLAVESGDAPMVPFEWADDIERREREVFDRFSYLYQATARRQGATRTQPHPPPADVTGLFPPSALRGRLHELRAQTFVSTATDIAGFDATDFVDQVAVLRDDMTALRALPRQATPADAPWRDLTLLRSYASSSPVHRVPQDARVAALARIFNATHLPSRADYELAEPWLAADLDAYLSRTLPTDSLLSERLALTSRAPSFWTTPLSWLYLVGNPVLRACEVLTAEYVDALARYLALRVDQLASARPAEAKPPLIVEIGAGSGRLTFFVRRQMAEYTRARFSFVATDAAGRSGDLSQSFVVHKRTHSEVLARMRPDILIASWMSKDADWTADMRAKSSVVEYILIGEVDYGASGTPAETWGVGRDYQLHGKVPPWRRDGFERYDLDDLSVLQIGRTDSPAVRFRSRTTAFRRVRPLARQEL